MEEIRKVSLRNKAMAVIDIHIVSDSARCVAVKGLAWDKTAVVDLHDLKEFKEGDVLHLEIKPRFGKDARSKEFFTYRMRGVKTAYFRFDGGTIRNKLTFLRVAKGGEGPAEVRGIKVLNQTSANGLLIGIEGGTKPFSYPLTTGLDKDRVTDLTEIKGLVDGDEATVSLHTINGITGSSYTVVLNKAARKNAVLSVHGEALSPSMRLLYLSDDFTYYKTPVRILRVSQYDKDYPLRICIKSGPNVYNVTREISLGGNWFDLADAADIIKDGDEFWMEATDDKKFYQPGERFIYQKASTKEARYERKDWKMVFNGIAEATTHIKSPEEEKLLQKIDAWEKKGNTESAWPGIKKSAVVAGLRDLADRYYVKTGRYTNFSTDGSSTQEYCTRVYQSDDYPNCGSVAIMFYAAKLNFSKFVDTVITLYEKGTLYGRPVEEKLRKASTDIANKYPCPGKVAEVCWMFQGSVTQEETNYSVKPEPCTVKMFMYPDEEARLIKLAFKATCVKHQRMATWATTPKALEHLDEWIKYLDNSGSVFWLMHANALAPYLIDTHKSFTHLSFKDLHWVVVLKAQKTAKYVYLNIHTWGQLHRIKVTHAEFRKMSYSAVLFKAK